MPNSLGVRLPVEFDFLKPDYVSVFRSRAQFLLRIRQTNSAEKLKSFYAQNPIQFIIDWGMIFEPRNPEIGLPTKIPFVMFPRQIEWCQWVLERWKRRERGMTIKSRGSGVSWLAVCLASTLCLFKNGIVVGFGSRKADYVDQLGDPKSLFFKARMFLENLPPEFRYGWNQDQNSRHMRLLFPHTESAMTGESGDGIGRGDRTGIYFVDEAGFLERPELTEASLSDTTNCRIDISTSPGSGTVFADRLLAMPEHQIFRFDWRDDPRRDQAWYEKKLGEIPLEIFKREYEMSLDEGGAFFEESSLLVDGKPVELPQHIDYVFAVIDTAVKSGKEHDGLAVGYFGVCKHGGTYPLTVLDWHLTQMDGAFLINWLPAVFERLEHFCKECKVIRGSAGAFIEDKVSGSVLIQQAKNAGLNVHEIDSRLTSMGKSERAINISGYVHTGQVKMTRDAYEKVVTFKAVTKNHMLAQILAFRAGGEDQLQDDCLDCFSYACALALGNSEGF